MTDAASTLPRALAWILICLVVTLSGCGGPSSRAPLGRAPDEGRPGGKVVRRTAPGANAVHNVRRGETLYAIAWRYGLDFRQIARWNGIASPYTIYPGQAIRLSPDTAPSAKPATTPRAASARRSTPASAPASKPAKVVGDVPSKRIGAWRWPTRGEVVGRFGAAGGKGIDISGRAGQEIVASAPGRVVYSGSGLRGYGKLIIIKHNNRYLSAYAHNQKLHVKEGDTVQSGQRIADMGQSDAKRIMLHFEIRRDGKPVDPLKHLPG